MTFSVQAGYRHFIGESNLGREYYGEERTTRGENTDPIRPSTVAHAPSQAGEAEGSLSLRSAWTWEQDLKQIITNVQTEVDRLALIVALL